MRGRLGLNLQELWRVLRFGLPNGVNWFLEFAAFVLFINVVVAHLGTTVLAAFNVVMQINSISFMPAFGVSSAGAIFVGEATGGSPNLYGDTVNHRMEWFGLTVHIPTLYWQKSTADDPRLSIEPDRQVSLTASDYFSGRDPVLAAALG